MLILHLLFPTAAKYLWCTVWIFKWQWLKKKDFNNNIQLIFLVFPTHSKNSLDENDVVPTYTKGGYDEHERSMEMYNDELDQYGRINNAGNPVIAGDAVLRAAIERHKQQNIDTHSQAELISGGSGSSSNPQTPNSMRSQKVVNNGGTVSNGGVGGVSHQNGGQGHMNIPQTAVAGPYFDNRGYEMQATEI